mgnify:CR=1 FL=1
MFFSRVYWMLSWQITLCSVMRVHHHSLQPLMFFVLSLNNTCHIVQIGKQMLAHIIIIIFFWKQMNLQLEKNDNFKLLSAKPHPKWVCQYKSKESPFKFKYQIFLNEMNFCLFIVTLNEIKATVLRHNKQQKLYN